MDLLIEATHRAEADHFWFRGFRRFVADALDTAAAGRHDLRALDCGCGTGSNIRLLGRHGTTFGFDLNQRGLEFARRGGHRRLARATVAAIPFASGSFDLVTSFDVLQSLPPDVERAALTEFRRVLRPGGTLVLTVAALEVLFGNHSVFARDLRRYNRRQIRSRVEQAGFRIDRLTFTYASLFPILLAVRSLQRATGLRANGRVQPEIAVPRPAINRPLDLLLALEAAVLRRIDMPIGSSLLCVATRS